MTAEIVTKSQFAELVGRDPAFVSRALKSGRIYSEAIVGEGRSARIHVAAAMEQLGRALDLGQQLAQTRPILPDTASPAPAEDGRPADLVALAEDGPDEGPPDADMGADTDTSPSALHDLREEQLDLRNRKIRLELARAERDAAQAAGQLLVAADVAAAIRRQVQPLAAIFDEIPPAIARAVADEFALDYAEVLICVGGALRAQRQGWARQARQIGADAGVMA